MENDMAKLERESIPRSRIRQLVMTCLGAVVGVLMGGLLSRTNAQVNSCPVDLQMTMINPGVSPSEPEPTAKGYLIYFNVIPETTFAEARFAFRMANRSGQKLSVTGWETLNSGFFLSDQRNLNLESPEILECNSFPQFISDLSPDRPTTLVQLQIGASEVAINFRVQKATTLIQGLKLINPLGSPIDFNQEVPGGKQYRLPVSEDQAFKGEIQQDDMRRLQIEVEMALPKPWNVKLTGKIPQKSADYTLHQDKNQPNLFNVQFSKKALGAEPHTEEVWFTAQFGSQTEVVIAALDLMPKKSLLGFSKKSFYLMLVGLVGVLLIVVLLYFIYTGRLSFPFHRGSDIENGSYGAEKPVSTKPSSISPVALPRSQPQGNLQRTLERMSYPLNQQVEVQVKLKEHDQLFMHLNNKLEEQSQEIGNLKIQLTALSQGQVYLYKIAEHQRYDFREIWMIIRDWGEYLSATRPESEILSPLQAIRTYWGRLVEGGGYREGDQRNYGLLSDILRGSTGDLNDPYLIYSKFLFHFINNSTKKIGLEMTHEIRGDAKIISFLNKLRIYFSEIMIGKPLLGQLNNLEITELVEIIPAQAAPHCLVKEVICYPFWLNNLEWSKPKIIAKGIVQLDIP